MGSVITFGCRYNFAESERIKSLTAAEENLIVFNTCAVTAEAERQARQAIRKARREHPSARIVVTGCASAVDPARYEAMPEVDAVRTKEHWLKGDVIPESFEGRVRAFVPIQTGCAHRCAFCIVPLARGKGVSYPKELIAAKVRKLLHAGAREIVLSGINISSYEGGLAPLARFLLDSEPELTRLAFSSLDPADVTPAFLALFEGEGRLLPHLHLSVQAGSDEVLKKMGRRHRRADILRIAETVRASDPDFTLGADLIAGFPTETEEDFGATLALVREAGLTHLHVFPYSERKGTAAVRLAQVPAPERKSRAARLRRAGGNALRRRMEKEVGGERVLLVESHKDGFSVGRTGHALSAEIEGVHPVGAEVSFTVTGVEKLCLTGSKKG